MTIKGQVLNASIEERDLVNKENVKEHVQIAHVLLICKNDKSTEVVNIRAYRPSFTIPEIGKEWITPPVKKYENFDGQVAQVVV